MLQQENGSQGQTEDQNKLDSELGADVVPKMDKSKEKFLFQSVKLRLAVHEISGLVNTRLSIEALKYCIVLIEAGVHPKVLAEIVMHILDVKNQKLEKEHGRLLP